MGNAIGERYRRVSNTSASGGNLNKEAVAAAAAIRRGRDCLKMGKYSQALDLFGEAILFNPDNADAYYYLGVASVGLEKHAAAIDCFTEAHKRSPGNALFLLYRGTAYCTAGQYERAVEDLNEAIRIDPGIEDYAYYTRAFAYLKLRKYKRAIEDATMALQIRCTGGAYACRAVAHLKLCQYEQSVEDSEEALRIEPNNEGAQRCRETALKHIKRLKEYVTCCGCKHFRMWKPTEMYCTVKKEVVDPLHENQPCYIERKGLKWLDFGPPRKDRKVGDATP